MHSRILVLNNSIWIARFLLLEELPILVSNIAFIYIFFSSCFEDLGIVHIMSCSCHYCYYYYYYWRYVGAAPNVELEKRAAHFKFRVVGARGLDAKVFTVLTNFQKRLCSMLCVCYLKSEHECSQVHTDTTSWTRRTTHFDLPVCVSSMKCTRYIILASVHWWPCMLYGWMKHLLQMMSYKWMTEFLRALTHIPHLVWCWTALNVMIVVLLLEPTVICWPE